MKQFAFALLSVLVLAMFSCKKNDYENIASFDSNAIQNYISANNLTMTKGDSGIYYQILKAGDTGNPITDTDRIFYAYTLRTMDGKFVTTDTVLNRVTSYVGLNSFISVSPAGTQATQLLPAGLQFGIKKYLQRRNGVIRLLIPSNQAYGVNGTSDRLYNTFPVVTVSGNVSLDYTVYLYNVNSQLAYDTVQIRNYIRRNNLTGFIKTPSGLYYKVVEAGNATDAIYSTSTITANYTKRLLLSGTAIETKSLDAATLSTYIAGWQEGLQHINSGGKIRLLVPSNLAYGPTAESTTVDASTYKVPPYSILDYDVNVTAVTN